MKLLKKTRWSSLCLILLVFGACQQKAPEGSWDYEIDFGDDQSHGVLKLKNEKGNTEGSLVSLEEGTFTLEKCAVEGR